MTLRELCEPLFLYVCKLNRSARNVTAIEYGRARAEIEAIFSDMAARAASVPGLAAQYEPLELPLMFFVDSLIAESRLPYAAEWHENRLAYGRKELAGDEKFFDVLDATLADPAETAKERLEILATCLGLGFEGLYAGQPEYIKRKLMDCSVKLRDRMDTHEAGRLCPEAYKHLDPSDLIEPPGARLLGIGLALAALIALILIVNVYVYNASTGELAGALDEIAADGVERAGEARP